MSELEKGTPTRTDRVPEPTPLSYFLKAIPAAIVLATLVQFVDSRGVWLFSVLCLLLAVPIFCRDAYFRAIRRTHWLSLFRDGGLGRRWFSGIWLRLVASFVTALALAVMLVFRLRALSWQEWITCAVAIPAFLIAARVLRRFVQEADVPFRIFLRAKLASWVTVSFLLLIYGVLLVLAIPDPSVSEFAPWMRAGSEGQIVSAAVAELDALHEGWRALEAFVLGHVADLGMRGRTAAFVVFVAGNIAFFYACASMLACLSIPMAEFSRAFCRVTVHRDPPTPTLAGVAYASAIITILACLFYFPFFANFEVTLAQLPPEQRPMHPVREWTATVNPSLPQRAVQLDGPSPAQLGRADETTVPIGVNPELPPKVHPCRAALVLEKIGGEFYRLGTKKKVSEAQLEFLSSQLRDVVLLAATIQRGFDLMEENVDVFLDWYYSLPGEYVRLAKFLTGSFEGYLADNLSAYLMQGAPFEEFERAFSAQLESESDLKRQYRETIKNILADNVVAVDEPGHVIVAEEISDADSLFSHQSVIASVETRLATSGDFGFDRNCRRRGSGRQSHGPSGQEGHRSCGQENCFRSCDSSHKATSGEGRVQDSRQGGRQSGGLQGRIRHRRTGRWGHWFNCSGCWNDGRRYCGGYNCWSGVWSRRRCSASAARRSHESRQVSGRRCERTER